MEQSVIKDVIIFYNGTYGNTDFLEHTRRLTEDGYFVNFICRGPKTGVVVYPRIIEVGAPSGIFGGLVFSLKAYLAAKKSVHGLTPIFIHVMYYKGCSLLGLLLGFSAVLDIRTGSVSGSHDKLKNVLIKMESRFFKYVSIISSDLALRLSIRHFGLLPIGCSIPKNINSGRSKYGVPPVTMFVYVGVLTGRRLQKFCAGFMQFLKESGKLAEFHIYGYGEGHDFDEVMQYSAVNGPISFNGYLEYARQADILARYHVGVSFIPCTEYFQDQPPTKTYEYLANGLPVIATCTKQNMLVVTEGVNGWLCDDDFESVCSALHRATDAYCDIAVDVCIDSIKNNQWSVVYEKYYKPLMLV